MEPVTLDVSKDGRVMIGWSDGHKSEHNPLTLRKACPCAMCRGEPGVFGKYYRVRQLQVSSDIQPNQIESVGKYGLKIIWNDGHDIGIYTYEYLRNLCECDTCAASRKGKSQ